MRRLIPLLCTTILLSAPIASACTLQFTLTPHDDGNTTRVSWTTVPGATQYEVLARVRNTIEYRQVTVVGGTAEPFVNAHPSSTEPQTYEYLVVARADNNDSLCVGTTSFELNGDVKLAAITHKRIVPLVGSVRGAFGSDFRTSLQLRHWPLVSGRIVFRPTGTLPSDNDPSLTYSFSDNGPNARDLFWDDVVAAMGASGTGSLEIIPNVRAGDGRVIVPEVIARVYNVTPQGTFGSCVEAVLPSDWMRNVSATGDESYSIPAVHGNFRRNAGFRTLTSLLYRVSVRYADGTGTTSSMRSAPANLTVFGSVEDLVGGPVPPDATVFVNFLSGSAIGFYTETENATNDPTVVTKNPLDVPGDVTWSF